MRSDATIRKRLDLAPRVNWLHVIVAALATVGIIGEIMLLVLLAGCSTPVSHEVTFLEEGPPYAMWSEEEQTP